MSESVIQPINKPQKIEVIQRVQHFIRLAESLYDDCFPVIPVQFDLKGRASGMYVLRNGQRYIRFNPYLFSKYYTQSLSSTVPHEVAHYIADLLYRLTNIRPHGPEWQSVMHDFGVQPNASGQFDLSGIPVRRQQRYSYRCACMTHEISTTRHNKICSGSRAYVCRKCGDPIVELSPA